MTRKNYDNILLPINPLKADTFLTHILFFNCNAYDLNQLDYYSIVWHEIIFKQGVSSLDKQAARTISMKHCLTQLSVLIILKWVKV